MLYNETLDIISSSDNKTSDSCIVYKILFIYYLSMAIYISFFICLKNRLTNPYNFGSLNINGY